jgi:hypothetical protein
LFYIVNIGWAVVALLLLVLPQPFISPLLSGAVGWGPSFEYGPLIKVDATNPFADAGLWYWYGVYLTDTRAALRRAAGSASLAWAGTTPDRRHCRHVMNDNGIPVNSTVYDAVIPCIQIHSITWPQEPPSEKTLQLSWDASNISRVGENPLDGDWPGNAVIYNPSSNLKLPIPLGNDSSQQRPYPAPYIFSGEMIVIMLVIEQTPMNNCTIIQPNIFNIQDNLFTNDTQGLYESCWAYAVVNFTAGVAQSRTSTYITSQVIEADETDENLVIEPGPWSQEATYLMADTMSILAAMNNTSLETYNNRTGYVDKLVRYSYQASYDALYRGFDTRNTVLSAQPQEPRIRATVSRGRVIAWLAASLLMSISSIVLVTNQLGNGLREIVLDGPTAALLTESSEVVEGERLELTRLSYTTGNDDVRLRLESVKRKNTEGFQLASI